MYRVGICDDGINMCALLEEMILKYAKSTNTLVETMVWYTGEILWDYLKQGNQLDILFLDIELMKMTGIEVGACIREKLDDRKIQIVYISAEASYAQRLFKTQPMDFLVKPIIQSQVDETLRLAFRLIRKRDEKFEYQSGKEFFGIFYTDILFFSSEGRKIKITTNHGESKFYGALKDIVKNLPSDFIWIHQSYVVNKNYIIRYAYETIELQNGTGLPISKANRKHVRELLMKAE